MRSLEQRGDLEVIVPFGRNVLLAWRVSRWTHQNRDVMVYRSWAEMRKMFSEGRSVVARRVKNRPLGIRTRRAEAHAALTGVFGDQGEIGAVVKRPSAKNGGASKLAVEASLHIPQVASLRRAFALVERDNEQSLAFFRRKLCASETIDIPSAAFGSHESMEQYVGFELFNREHVTIMQNPTAQTAI